MDNDKNLETHFAKSKKLTFRIISFFLLLISISLIPLIYLIAPDKLSLIFKTPFIFLFILLPILFLSTLLLSFLAPENNGITEMGIKHNHFFMRVYDKNKTKHDLSIPIEDIQSVQILVTQIFNCDGINDNNKFTIITTGREITEDNCIKANTDPRYASIIYLLTINIRDEKSFNIITEIYFDSIEFKEYFNIPRKLPNFSYEIKDIVTDSDIITKMIDSYISRGKGLGVIGHIHAFFTSKDVPTWRKVALLCTTGPLLLFLIALIIYDLFIK